VSEVDVLEIDAMDRSIPATLGTVDPRRGDLGAVARRHRQERISRGLRPVPHLVAEIHFGEGRFTTCTACDYRATGATNEDMADRWAAHSRPDPEEAYRNRHTFGRG
jgi:hypothetical protein